MCCNLMVAQAAGLLPALGALASQALLAMAVAVTQQALPLPLVGLCQGEGLWRQQVHLDDVWGHLRGKG
jgi:hypothetical protein